MENNSAGEKDKKEGKDIIYYHTFIHFFAKLMCFVKLTCDAKIKQCRNKNKQYTKLL